MNSSPIFVKTYDLILWLMPVLAKFPKEERFRLAARLENSVFCFQEMLLKAVRVRERRAILLEADLELEKLRLYLRLGQDLHHLSFDQYTHAAKMVNEVGKLLGGWMKTVEMPGAS